MGLSGGVEGPCRAATAVGGSRDAQPSEVSLALLFVCTGNLCRSPTAQFLLAKELGAPHLGADAVADSRHHLELSGRLVELSSCGTRTVPGLGMDELSAAELRRRGSDPSDFRSSELTFGRIATVDLVLTATRSHRSLVLELEPRAMGRTFTMLEFAALLNLSRGQSSACRSTAEAIRSAASQRWRASGSPIDLADPRGQSEAIHRITADTLQEAMTVIGAGLRFFEGAGGQAVT